MKYNPTAAIDSYRYDNTRTPRSPLHRFCSDSSRMTLISARKVGRSSRPPPLPASVANGKIPLPRGRIPPCEPAHDTTIIPNSSVSCTLVCSIHSLAHCATNLPVRQKIYGVEIRIVGAPFEVLSPRTNFFYRNYTKAQPRNTNDTAFQQDKNS